MAWQALVGPALTAAGIGASLYGAMNQKRPSVPDIGAEIARIRQLYAEARAQATQEAMRVGQDLRGQAAQGLATRGILRSPVSENVFGRIREETQREVGRQTGRLAEAEAGAIGGALGQLLQLNMAAQEKRAQQDAARWGAVAGGIGALGDVAQNFQTPMEQPARFTPMAPQGQFSPMVPSPAAQQFTQGRTNQRLLAAMFGMVRR